MRTFAAFATLLAVLLLASPARAIDPTPPFPDPVVQQRYITLIHELRCLKCQGENIADTPALFAQDIRRQVREMLAAGRSDAEIRGFLVDRYGDVILLRPRFNARNAWLWLSPGVLLLAGGLVAWRVLASRRRLLDDDVEPVDDEGRPA